MQQVSPNYADMYLELFNAISRTISILQLALQETHGMYIVMLEELEKAKEGRQTVVCDECGVGV